MMDRTDEDRAVVHLDDYQYRKEPDVWSGALWLGAALQALVLVARTPGLGDEHFNTSTARTWVDRVPVEVKATWPGTFPEFPYDGEPPEEHARRMQADSL